MKGLTLGEGIKLTKKMFSDMVKDEGCNDDAVYAVIAIVQSDRKLLKGYNKVFETKMTPEGAKALENILTDMCKVGFTRFMHQRILKTIE